MRAPHGEPATKVGKVLGTTGRLLSWTDRTTRLVLDDAFKQLTAEGLVPNTETARREYTNQLGQYNRRAQGLIVKIFRDTGFGPFVTAGRTFLAMGWRMGTLSPGVPATSLKAAAALRANVATKWIGAFALLAAANYLLTKHLKNGGVMGRPGTKFGNIDMGYNDKSGKMVQFPLMDALGLGKSLHVEGIRGAVDAYRLGLTPGDMVDAAARDIINSDIAPFAGPPVKFGVTAISGYPAAVNVGRVSTIVPPGQSQFAENLSEAMKQANPMVTGARKLYAGKSAAEVLSTQIPRYSLAAGKTEATAQNYLKIVTLAQAAQYTDGIVHDARRLPPEERLKFVSDQINRMAPDLRPHAWKEMRRRRVFALPQSMEK
jgi:hypothetical protein